MARVIAIKRSVELCPWADVVYGCDRPWWLSVRGLPDFAGLKISFADTGLDGIRRIQIAKGRGIEPWSDELSFMPGVIGGAGNSGFQALNLALQWGARRVVLVGFDMVDDGRAHWYGRNIWPGANNPTGQLFRKWVGAFERSAPTLQRIGAEVVNASPGSAIGCFRKISIPEILAEWSA